jgi:hypothetical protein
MLDSINLAELESHILRNGYEFVENHCSQFDTQKRVTPYDLSREGKTSLGKANNTRDKDECYHEDHPTPPPSQQVTKPVPSALPKELTFEQKKASNSGLSDPPSPNLQSFEIERTILSEAVSFLSSYCFHFNTTKTISNSDIESPRRGSLGKARNTKDKDECSYWSSGIQYSPSGIPTLSVSFKTWQGGGQIFKWSSYETTKAFLESGGITPQSTCILPTLPLAPPAATPVKTLKQKKDIALRAYTGLATTGSSLYLQKKGFSEEHLRHLTDIRFGENFVAIPMFSSFTDYENCTPCGLQKIYDDGSKKFTKHSHLFGSFFVIGNIENPEKIMICEGLATGLSIHLASRIPVIVSFNAGNLEPVAKEARERFPEITICADNDQWKAEELNQNTGKKKGNTGILKGIVAAKACGGKLVYPIFNGLDCSSKPTDFNDLMQLAGLDEVKKQLEAAILSTYDAFINFDPTKPIYFVHTYHTARAIKKSLGDINVAYFKHVPQIKKLVEVAQKRFASTFVYVLISDFEEDKLLASYLLKGFNNVELRYPSAKLSEEPSTLSFDQLYLRYHRAGEDAGKHLNDLLIKKQSVIARFVTDTFLPPLEFIQGKKQTFFLKSNMGTGKSTAIITGLKKFGGKFLTVVPRVTLAGAEVVRYLQYGLSVNDYRDTIVNDSTVICCNSLAKIKDLQPLIGDWVLNLEEISQVIQQLLNMKNVQGDALINEYNILKELISNAGHVVCSDANLDQKTIEFIAALRSDSELILWDSKKKTGTGRAARFWDDETAMLVKAKNAVLSGGRVAFASSAKKAIADFSTFARQHGANVLEITDDTTGGDAQKAFFKDPNSEINKYQVFAYSPSLTCGVSVDDTPEFIPFDMVIALFSSLHGPTFDSCLQQLGRLRYPHDLDIYVAKRDEHLPDTFEAVDAQLKLKILPVLYIVDRMFTDEGIFGCSISDVIQQRIDAIYGSGFNKAQIENIAKQNSLKNDFYGNIKCHLEQMDFNVSVVNEESTMKERLDKRLLSDEVAAKTKADVLAAPMLSEREAKKLRESFSQTYEEKIALKKYDLQHYYTGNNPIPITVDSELYDFDNLGKMRHALTQCLYVIQPNLALKRDVLQLFEFLDEKEGVASIKACRAKSEVYKKVLEFAGITVDGDKLVHDGSKLSVKTLGPFIDWVLKNRKLVELIRPIPTAKKLTKDESKISCKRRGLSKNPTQFILTFLKDLGISFSYSEQVREDSKVVRKYALEGGKFEVLNLRLQNLVKPHEYWLNAVIPPGYKTNIRLTTGVTPALG